MVGAPAAVRLVFDALRAHDLHLQHSKCSFGSSSVAYLGHVISTGGVAMDNAKLEAVASWPAPRSARGVRGFLGLVGYYGSSSGTSGPSPPP